MASEVLLEVKNLKKYFKTKNGTLHAVDDVTFTINRGRTLGIVGESGCGKTTIGRTVLRLTEPTSGTVLFSGEDVTKCTSKRMIELRRKMQIIFQDPFSSLNPRKSVTQIIEDPMKVHKLYTTKRESRERVAELMETVGLAERFANSYPHELDGGRRQRIGIARALSLNPEFIVCDEPVSALDVSIQAQVLNLLNELQGKLGLTYIFISHDLSVVNYISDDIAVMYLGRLVEKAPTRELFTHTLHPYTKALLSAIPAPTVGKPKKARLLLKGELASPINPKPCCRFANRCAYCQNICTETEPELREVYPGHFVACHLADKLQE